MRIIKISIILFVFTFCSKLFLTYPQNEEVRKISVEEFIEIACEKDTAFTQILIEELKLKYKKALALPAEDLVLSVESQYNFRFNPSERDTESTISLSKLFPYTGTEFSTEYTSSVSSTTRNVSSGFTLELSQAIARNAFGRNTRLLDKITGIEIDVARFQIVEAYEAYLASLIQLYYDWYSAYENLKTAVNSYDDNLKLLENMKEREKNRIALPIDVNKISLQVSAKKENLIILQNEYDDYFTRIKEAIRYQEDVPLQPQESSLHTDLAIEFEADYETFKTSSRTTIVLKLLEDQSSLEVDKYADELLPSINLILGYAWDGSGYGIENSERVAYTGVSIDWPLPGQVKRADYETSKIDLRQTKLSSETIHARLHTDLKNLNNQMQKEKDLISVAKEKVILAENIVRDEKQNYSLGRSTLNDLIDEINKLESNKFNKITHDILLRKLTVEWLRLTDTLIKKSDIVDTQSVF